MITVALPFKTGLPPVADQSARVLILGTFPGDMSLATRQYYANPQNYFWSFMSALGMGRLSPGKAAERVIKDHHLALWDVFHKARRKGSADAAIDLATAVPNNFQRFLAGHRQVELIVFNGQKAEAHFQRFVVREQPELEVVATITLPSTSPANTGMTISEKKQQWRQLRRRIAI